MKRFLKIIVMLTAVLCLCFAFAACDDSAKDEPHTHHFENYVDDNNATCTKDGTETGKCSCGQTDTRTKVGSALGHIWDNGRITKISTCTTEGEKILTCERCNTTKKEVIPIDPEAHNFGKWVSGVPAECEKDGVKGYYRCKNCKKCFNEQKEELDDLTIKQLGHDNRIQKVGGACELGVFEISTCNRCGEMTYKQVVFPKAHTGERICKSCGLDMMKAYQNYVIASGSYVAATDTKQSYYRITYNDEYSSEEYYQYQWCYMQDGMIEWRVFDILNGQLKTFFEISWKPGDKTYNWECGILFTSSYGMIMKGAVNPHTITQDIQYLDYSDLLALFPTNDQIRAMQKFSAASLRVILSCTEVILQTPEGYGIHAFGFTSFFDPQMIHMYSVSSVYAATPTKDGKIEFKCSHCKMTRTITFHYNDGTSAANYYIAEIDLYKTKPAFLPKTISINYDTNLKCLKALKRS